MDAFIQAQIDQCQAPLDHPRNDQRREQVIDGRVQPVLSRTVPRPPRTWRLDDLGDLPHGVVGAVQHADPQRLVHAIQALACLVLIRPAGIGFRALLLQRRRQPRNPHLGAKRDDRSANTRSCPDQRHD